MLYDRNIIGTSSEIFGYLRQSSENVRRRSSSLRNNFGKSSEIFEKWSEIFGKSSKTSLLVCLYNKQNNTWTRGDMEFMFSCSHSISHSFISLTHFEITGYPCNLIGSQWCDLFTNRTIFCSKSHLFLSQREWDSKTKATNQIPRLNTKISGKWKAKSHCVENFATAVAKTLLLFFSTNCAISKWI